MKNIIIFITIFICIFTVKADEWVTTSNFLSDGHTMSTITSFDSNTYAVAFQRTDIKKLTQGAVIYETQDYGTTWNQILSNEVSAFDLWEYNVGATMQYVGKDSLYAYINLEKGRLGFFKTFDGGKNWDTMHIMYVSANSEMIFKNAMEGFIPTINDTLLHTTDGGESWSVIQLPNLSESHGYLASSLNIIEDNILILAGYWNDYSWKRILFSSDNGKTWEIKDFGADSVYGIHCLRMRTAEEWWWVGDSSFKDNSPDMTMAKKTTDKGETWKEVKIIEELGSLQDIVFFGDSIRVLSLDNAFRSTDNGNSWTKEYFDDNTHQFRWAMPTFNKGMISNFFRRQVFKLIETNSGIFEEDINPFFIYPNPAQDFITIMEENIHKYQTYEISDLMGRSVQSGTLESDKIMLEDFPAGIYFLKLISTTETKSMKFVVGD